MGGRKWDERERKIKGQEGKNAREGKKKEGSIEKGLKHEGKKAGKEERWT
jgi:hypothetical protein